MWWLVEIFSILGLVLGAIAALFRWHIGWLQNTKSIEEERRLIRNDLENKEFARTGDKYIVSQIDYVDEKSELLYHIKKRIPYLRKLRGSATVTVKSIEFPGRDYVWQKEEYGVDFNTYLNDKCTEEFPEVEIVDIDLDQSMQTKPTIRLCIHSLDPTEISKTIEQIPKFQEFYFDNYIGDGRYRTG